MLQFKPGAILTVEEPMDDDDGVTNVRWQWYRSSSPTAPGDPIDDATMVTYNVQDTSADNDVGMYLRVVATYDDRRGFNKTAEYVSENPVQAARNNLNANPTFPLYNVTRGIEENSKGDIGSPVTGMDADVSDQSAVADILTYSLLPANGNNNDIFDIDRATGQLSVDGLDFEDATDVGLSDDDAVNPMDNTYVVMLKATDSSGDDSLPVTVVITVTDVNEKPEFGIDGVNDGFGGITGMAPDHREDSLDAGDNTMVDLTISTYTATDPEGGDVTLSLTGDDADMFELADDSIDDGPNASRVLSFKEKPDFEMKGDSNSDNIYEVTVVASDGENTATRSVTVKVTDADEAGKVTLSAQDALIGVELTATLTDSDGGVPDEDRFMRQEWQWYSLVSETVEVFNNGVLNTDLVGGTEVRQVLEVGDDEATYTPDANDRDRHLRAMVTYTDRTRDTDNMPDDNTALLMFVGFTNTAMSDATTAVRNNPMNQAPEFTDGTSTFRLVEENTKALSGDVGDTDADDDALPTDNPADNVGGLPVMATDDDDDTVAYTLGGRDKDMFRVRANGQLEVSDKANLDHETNSSHTVTVIADDNVGEPNSKTTITVTIYVTDLDEPPTIADAGDSTVKDNRQSVMYAEDRTDAVLTLSGEDPEGVSPIVWSIFVDATGMQDIDGDGEDDVDVADVANGGLFKVNDDGELTFKASPNFEMPGTADETNTYKVVVQASDGGVTDKLNWFKVTVNITDVEEDGKLAKWTVDPDGLGGDEDAQDLLQFKPGAILTVVNPMDDDGVEAGTVEWQWYRSSSPTAPGDPINDEDGDPEDSPTYTVQDTVGNSDVKMYLRVVATYDDSRGDGKTAEYVSENPVQATRNNENTAPTFPFLDNTARRITENAKGDFGSPVTGTDADVSDQSAVADILTYSLLPANGNDNDTFKIDRATGQLSVDGLDFEMPSDAEFPGELDGDTGNNIYVVTLKATDSSGADSADVTVLVTVTDVNEKPEFGIDGVNDGFGGITGMAPDHREDSLDAGDNTMVDLTISTYTATDPEGGDVTLSLTGDDADMFELADDSLDDGPNASRVLSFKEKPDFEMKGDSNSDNIYEVTVVASDGANTAMRSVTVKVTDADEGGMITLSSQDALIGVELTAELADSDGGVPDEDRFMRQEWEWQKATPVGEATCDATNVVGNTTWAKAGSDSAYTPEADDRGDCLRAMVTYTDRTRDTDNMDNNNGATDTFVGFTNMATSDATTKVRNNPDNQAPEFTDGASTFRLVEENTKALSGADGETDADDDAADAEDNPADTWAASLSRPRTTMTVTRWPTRWVGSIRTCSG